MASKRSSFGSTFRRKRGDGTLFPGWYVRWTDHDGRRRQCKGGDTKAEAEDFLAERRLEKRHHEIHGAVPVQKGSFRAVLREAWPIMSRPWGASTVKLYETTMEVLTSEIGDVQVSALTTAHLQAALDRIRAKRNIQAGLHTYKKLLAAFMKAAVELNYHRTNIARDLVVPRTQKEQGVRLSPREQALMVRHADDKYRPMLKLLLGTGVRISEALALCWQDVDMARGEITVRRSRPGSDRTKSLRVRVIPIGGLARQALEEMRSTAIIPMRGAARVWQGSQYRQVRAAINSAAKSAGLPKVNPHDLRRAFAASLDEAGVSVFEIKDLLGHADVTTTQTYVGRASRERLRGAIGALDELHQPRPVPRSKNDRMSSG